VKREDLWAVGDEGRGRGKRQYKNFWLTSDQTAGGGQQGNGLSFKNNSGKSRRTIGAEGGESINKRRVQGPNVRTGRGLAPTTFFLKGTKQRGETTKIPRSRLSGKRWTQHRAEQNQALV